MSRLWYCRRTRRGSLGSIVICFVPQPSFRIVKGPLHAQSVQYPTCIYAPVPSSNVTHQKQTTVVVFESGSNAKENKGITKLPPSKSCQSRKKTTTQENNSPIPRSFLQPPMIGKTIHADPPPWWLCFSDSLASTSIVPKTRKMSERSGKAGMLYNFILSRRFFDKERSFHAM